MHRLLLLSLLIPLSATAADVPGVVTHQGRIFDQAGVPLTGAHDLDIKLFDAPASGTEVWSDSLNTDFDNGYYAVVLGASTPLTAVDLDHSQLWVEITVDSGAPLTRTELTSVPYAIRAQTAVDATNVTGGVVDASEIMVGGTTVIDDTGTFVGNAGSQLDDLGCSADEVASFDGLDWGCAPNPASHNHDATHIDSGVFDIARLPVGTAATDVAAGDHLHGLSQLTGQLVSSQLPTDFGAQVTSAVAADLDSALGVSDPANDARHTRYADSEALAATSAAYVDVAGDTMAGTLVMNGAAALHLDSAADPGIDFAVRGNAENFEVYEPEDGDKVHLRINDGGAIELLPDGAAGLTVDTGGAGTLAGALTAGGAVTAGGTVTSGGDVVVSTGSLMLNSAGDPGVEYAVRGNAENFEIYEPEDGNKVHLRINDQGSIELLPNGAAGITVEANGNATVAGHVWGTRYAFQGYTNGFTSFVNLRTTTYAEVTDRGGVFNGSAFTAPRDGLYQFHFSASFRGGAVNDDTCFIHFRRTRGATNTNMLTLTINPRWQTNGNGLEDTVVHSALLELQAGDVVQPYFTDNTAGGMQIGNRSFSGYYLGE